MRKAIGANLSQSLCVFIVPLYESKQHQPTYLFNWADIQKIDHAVLHIANGQNKILFGF